MKTLDLTYLTATHLIDAANGIAFRESMKNISGLSREILRKDRHTYKHITGESYNSESAAEYVEQARKVRAATITPLSL